MEIVSLSEFLRITLLSERDVIGMLERGELETVKGEAGETLVDLGKIDEHLIASRAALPALGIDEKDRELVEEIIASEVLFAVDEVIDEALEMALRWQKESQTKESD